MVCSRGYTIRRDEMVQRKVLERKDKLFGNKIRLDTRRHREEANIWLK